MRVLVAAAQVTHAKVAKDAKEDAGTGPSDPAQGLAERTLARATFQLRALCALCVRLYTLCDETAADDGRVLARSRPDHAPTGGGEDDETTGPLTTRRKAEKLKG